MNIQIHRGLDQIGGCITEISTATSRVFIDFGQNIPGVGTPPTPEEDKKLVDAIVGQNIKPHQAVFYTHAHEDHVGLFHYLPEDIPQYMGEGGKEMLLAKYDLIKKGNETELNVATKVTGSKHSETIRRIQQVIEQDEAFLSRIKHFKTFERTKPHYVPQAVEVGDIRVTPFYNCHSIYDSYMFLIEADGKRIWHTGDYREHGYLGKGLMPTLRKYATDIDILITEGTLLARTDECIHEREVSRRMECMTNAFKYVVVLASATDIERLASIKEASKKARRQLYVCNGYTRRTMSIFNRREAKASKGLFEFHPKYVNFDDPKIEPMREKGFVMIAGAINLTFAEELCEGLDPNDVLLIYSSWDGYYKNPEQVRLNPRYKYFREAFHNVVDIHTSGHADRKTIEKVINLVKPKEVIFIHKEAGARL